MIFTLAPPVRHGVAVPYHGVGCAGGNSSEVFTPKGT